MSLVNEDAFSVRLTGFRAKARIEPTMRATSSARMEWRRTSGRFRAQELAHANLAHLPPVVTVWAERKASVVVTHDLDGNGIGIREYESEEDNKSKNYSRNHSKHVVSEAKVTSQELLDRLPCLHPILNLAKLRYYQTVQSVSHGSNEKNMKYMYQKNFFTSQLNPIIEYTMRPYTTDCTNTQSRIHARRFFSIENCSLDGYHGLHGRTVLETEKKDSAIHRAHGIQQYLPSRSEIPKHRPKNDGYEGREQKSYSRFRVSIVIGKIDPYNKLLCRSRDFQHPRGWIVTVFYFRDPFDSFEVVDQMRRVATQWPDAYLIECFEYVDARLMYGANHGSSRVDCISNGSHYNSCGSCIKARSRLVHEYDGRIRHKLDCYSQPFPLLGREPVDTWQPDKCPSQRVELD
ncbi:hypothetical protein STAS_22053 [Striga asiatica]|uniref:Uncharacterized protein n=1 Tax=Striga asiatica TaxID=4170 RepID=A0A5A7QJ90_STRAF|nr:hypothetical protein STAS_22053 [Striga asiatica]